MLAEAGDLVPPTPQREACSLGSFDCVFMASSMCLNTHLASVLSVACKGLYDQGLLWMASTVTGAAEVGWGTGTIRHTMDWCLGHLHPGPDRPLRGPCVALRPGYHLRNLCLPFLPPEKLL